MSETGLILFLLTVLYIVGNVIHFRRRAKRTRESLRIAYEANLTALYSLRGTLQDSVNMLAILQRHDGAKWQDHLEARQGELEEVEARIQQRVAEMEAESFTPPTP